MEPAWVDFLAQLEPGAYYRLLSEAALDVQYLGRAANRQNVTLVFKFPHEYECWLITKKDYEANAHLLGDVQYLGASWPAPADIQALLD